MGDNGTPAQVVQDSYERPKVKWSLYQWWINTPLIVSGAWISRLGQREDALINSVDIFSTVLNLANTGVSQMHDSKSFATLLQGENATTRDYIYWEVWGDGRQAGHTIRNTQYKYLVLDSGREFFYDLLDDPYEQDNIISRLDDDASLSLDSLKNTLEIIRGDQ
jgi:arylsulfatase A-like enzyme